MKFLMYVLLPAAVLMGLSARAETNYIYKCLVDYKGDYSYSSDSGVIYRQVNGAFEFVSFRTKVVDGVPALVIMDEHPNPVASQTPKTEGGRNFTTGKLANGGEFLVSPQEVQSYVNWQGNPGDKVWSLQCSTF